MREIGYEYHGSPSTFGPLRLKSIAMSVDIEPSNGADGLADPKIEASSKSTSIVVLEYHHSPSKIALSTRLVCTWLTGGCSVEQAHASTASRMYNAAVL